MFLKATTYVGISASFGVRLWHNGQYLTNSELGPPSLFPLQFLKNHIVSHDIATIATLDIQN
ncbi:uncharacterized protein LACBIDRAFT_306440 [Laccaria bicolor S238N-H82]|uniref:Predicted protein n=1 Tax=Laccaria bicolor (strain S238N-H82 / ATCC MYA-4686) TaxID=486041 RepID=B0DMX7_LACBS|nr:uncharacterized protein LACBIDRAFT_306440 [Laccaria bicolor S238N-H82]EDR04051.1 predicted protein [Laccaria bicolor S238N-H82]|eukprot:XP_001885306.1 predicted protein [Laccaria bicolor S238N-H82]